MSTSIADQLQLEYPHMKYMGKVRGEPPPPSVYEPDIEVTQDVIDRLSIDEFEALLDDSINNYGYKDELECMADACLQKDTEDSTANLASVGIYSFVCVLLVGCLILYLFRMREEQANLSGAKQRRTLLSNCDEAFIVQPVINAAK